MTSSFRSTLSTTGSRVANERTPAQQQEGITKSNDEIFGLQVSLTFLQRCKKEANLLRFLKTDVVIRHAMID